MKIFGFLWLIVVLILNGCYSFSASTLPSHIKTIIIYPTENKTLHTLAGDKMTEKSKQMFSLQAPSIRQVNSLADAEFYVTLKQYDNDAGSISGSNVTDYVVKMKVDVVFKDIIKDEVIYEGKDLVGIGRYSVTDLETEEGHGQERAIDEIIQVVVSSALSKW